MWRLTPFTTLRPRYDFAMSSVARVCIYFLLASGFLFLASCGGRITATYEHPITLSKESQRIPRDLAVFGIKNAREMSFRSRQHEFLLLCNINQATPLALAVTLLNSDIS